MKFIREFLQRLVSKRGKCEKASVAQLSAIWAGCKRIPLHDVAMQNGFTVKSPDFESVWFVGLQVGARVGVWAVGGSKEKPNLVLSVNQVAKAISDYPDAWKTKAKISMYDQGARQVEKCAKRGK